MHRFALALLAFAFLVVPASAQAQWRDFRSQTDDFSVSLPDEPTITSRQMSDKKSTQSMYRVDVGDFIYLISVINMEKGTGLKDPDRAYYQDMLKDYAEDSETSLRHSRPANIAGKPGIEGQFEGSKSRQQVQILVDGDRIYLLVYAGPKGQYNSEDATRFRSSFRLTR